MNLGELRIATCNLPDYTNVFVSVSNNTDETESGLLIVQDITRTQRPAAGTLGSPALRWVADCITLEVNT